MQLGKKLAGIKRRVAHWIVMEYDIRRSEFTAFIEHCAEGIPRTPKVDDRPSAAVAFRATRRTSHRAVYESIIRGKNKIDHAAD